MGQAKAKLQRKILRQELKAKLEEERVTIMPEIKTLKDAVLNLKPCFECFGLTFFKTKDVVSFYNVLKEWIGERPHREAKANMRAAFKKLKEPEEVKDENSVGTPVQ